MVDKSNEYGYVPSSPTQARGSNTGVFEVNDVNDLLLAEQWSGDFGKLELIETQNASADSTVDFIDLATNSYNVYFVTVNDLQTSATSQARLRFSNNNGSSFIASGYQYATQNGNTAGTFGVDISTSKAQINTGLLSDTSTGSSANGYFYLYNLLDSTKYSFTSLHNFNSYSVERFSFGSGVLPTAETHNAFQIAPSAGNISATISLYGIRYS